MRREPIQIVPFVDRIGAAPVTIHASRGPKNRADVLGWYLHGKIGGLFAFEDAINVSGSAPVLVDKINTIGDQNAIRNIISARSDRRKFMLNRKRIDQFAMS